MRSVHAHRLANIGPIPLAGNGSNGVALTNYQGNQGIGNRRDVPLSAGGVTMAGMFSTDCAVSRGYHALPPDLARTWAERRLGEVAVGACPKGTGGPRSQIQGLPCLYRSSLFLRLR